MSHYLSAARAHIENVKCLGRDPHWACWDCYATTDPYMVRDEVWLRAFSEYTELRLHLKPVLTCKTNKRDDDGEMRLVLCFNCLEYRLKRKLNIYDLTDTPINRTLRRGAEMALEGLNR